METNAEPEGSAAPAEQLDLLAPSDDPVQTMLARYVERERALIRLVLLAKEKLSEVDDARSLLIEQVELHHKGLDRSVIEAVVDLHFSIRSLVDGEVDLSPDGEGVSSVSRYIDLAMAGLPEGYDLGSIMLDAEAASRGQQPAQPILYASLLTSLVGGFEVLVSEVAEYLYLKYPNSLDLSEATYTWKEIVTFGTLDDFRKSAVDDAVSGLMRGSLDTWLEHFAKRHGIRVSPNVSGPDVWDVFQRRHLVVHTGGKVSSTYLEKCRLDNPPELGTVVEIDPSALVEAADLLSALAMHLLWAVAHSCLKGEELRSFESYAANVPYRMLLDKRPGAAVLQTSVVATGSALNETSDLVLRVNCWLAKKRLGRLEECRREIEDWPTGTLSEQYKLAKLALLDDLPGALAIVKEIRGTDKLPMHFWQSWPLLEELREYEARVES